MYRTFLRTTVLATAIMIYAGCACDNSKFGTPNLTEPGYISIQQTHMNQFEPFCRSDIGPRIPGDRPHGALSQTPREQHLKRYYKLYERQPYTAWFLPARNP